ncbi:GNAT family N-acetyltransferase [Aeromicrobium sp. Root472D3]|uniref:GNAT family N-acetyltransferase n=1 Tax=Aeromicrobium sp. Root472D3 TaxID=1736540 RepID=UPI0006F31C84|nr:GNAT family N-acetyltransferase [Aeromicrobium sp. Root472D3]KQX74126.1 GCN5 family acetyltransferase [Aeromicrobium sp. Root472D3]
MTEIVVRPATVADVGAVLALWTVGAENADRPSDSAADVERLLARDPEALVLATDGEDVVGSVIVGWDGWRCHLYRLAVHPSHRRRGIGRTLLEHAEQRFAAVGGKRADAMVLDGNDLGASIWTDAGYSRQPEWSRWVKPL